MIINYFQGKTIWQAEIDAAAEMIDFLRFNVQFARVSGLNVLKCRQKTLIRLPL